MTDVISGSLALMLLEDNVVLSRQIMETLRAWPHSGTILHCRDVATAYAAVASEARLDVLVADLHLPDGSGIDVIRSVRRHHPDSITIVMSALNDGPVVLEAIRAGAAGYVDKADTSIDLILAIEQAIAGMAPMSGTIARLIVKSLQEPDPDPLQPRLDLTRREAEVLDAIARGFSNREVAEIFGISPQTVPVHTRNIYRKLEVSNKTEAVFIARQHGLIP